MPTYDYECNECKTRFEVFQKMSDEPVSLCPTCGNVASRIISGGANVVFKGEGFYVNDSRNKSCPDKGSSPCCQNCTGKN